MNYYLILFELWKHFCNEMILRLCIILCREAEEGKIPEWGLIEFQGSLATRDNDPKSLFGEHIGDLNYTKDVSVSKIVVL